MRNIILDQLKHFAYRTPREIAKATGQSQSEISRVMAEMAREGALIVEHEMVGYDTYTLNKEHAPMPEKAEKTIKPKSPYKRFSPNQIAGAYIAHGNVIIKLSRRASSRSLTLTGADLETISTLYKSVKNNG